MNSAPTTGDSETWASSMVTSKSEIHSWRLRPWDDSGLQVNDVGLAVLPVARHGAALTELEGVTRNGLADSITPLTVAGAGERAVDVDGLPKDGSGRPPDLPWLLGRTAEGRKVA